MSEIIGAASYEPDMTVSVRPLCLAVHLLTIVIKLCHVF